MTGLVAVVTSVGLVGVGMPAVAHATPVAAIAGPSVPEAPASAAADDGGSDDEGAATKAAILPVVVEGDPMPEADVDKLAGRLVDGLERGAFEVVAPAQVAESSPGAESCNDSECFAGVAKATGASHVVRAVIKVDDRDYQVRMILADRRGVEMATASDSCQICGVAEVADLIDAAAATLRTKLDALSQGPATLIISSTPPGARVYIDGELKGTTPFDAPVIPGKHVLRISMDGFITVEREATFVEGIEESQSFELEKVPSRLPARPWGWVSIGAGAAGLATAGFFTYLGQSERDFKLGGECDMPDAEGDCPRIWNTEAIVLGSAVAGAALTTLGIAILLTSSRRRGEDAAEQARRRRRPRLGIGLGRVTVQGRF